MEGSRSGRLGTARDGSGPVGMLGMGAVVCNGRSRKLLVTLPYSPSQHACGPQHAPMHTPATQRAHRMPDPAAASCAGIATYSTSGHDQDDGGTSRASATQLQSCAATACT